MHYSRQVQRSLLLLTGIIFKGGYYIVNISDIDGLDPHGFGIGGAKSLGKNVFVRGSYSMTNDDIFDGDVDFDQGSACVA